jgi:regulatory protein
VGVTIEGPDIEELSTVHALASGTAYAYRLLALRDRSEREIREALAKEGISVHCVVEEIVASLKRNGYLDDRRLAAGYIRFRLEHKPAGPYLLRRKLEQAGVDEAVIEDELESAFGPGLEEEIAIRLATSKLKGIRDRERGVRRVHGFLSRRGFSGAIVSRICAKILNGEISGENHEQ